MKEATIFPINLLSEIFLDEIVTYPADIDGTVGYVISRYDERVQKVILGRYKDGKSYGQLASELGVSPERARQIATKALRQMRSSKCRKFLSAGIAEYISQIRISAAENALNGQISEATEVIKLFADRISKITGDDELAVMIEKQEAESRRQLSIDEIGLSVRSFNILKRAGLHTVGDILHCGDLSTVQHMGERCLAEITQKIRNLGFELKNWGKTDGQN